MWSSRVIRIVYISEHSTWKLNSEKLSVITVPWDAILAGVGNKKRRWSIIVWSTGKMILTAANNSFSFLTIQWFLSSSSYMGTLLKKVPVNGSLAPFFFRYMTHTNSRGSPEKATLDLRKFVRRTSDTVPVSSGEYSCHSLWGVYDGLQLENEGGIQTSNHPREPNSGPNIKNRLLSQRREL